MVAAVAACVLVALLAFGWGRLAERRAWVAAGVYRSLDSLPGQRIAGAVLLETVREMRRGPGPRTNIPGPVDLYTVTTRMESADLIGSRPTGGLKPSREYWLKRSERAWERWEDL